MACDGQCFYLDSEDELVKKSPKAFQHCESPTSLVTETSRAVYCKIWPWQTRLLKLQPLQSDSDCNLHVNLVAVNLVITEGAVIEGTHETVAYDAMSYTWGHQRATRPLSINGRVLPITENSEAALMSYRSTLASEPGYIWIDAICIDQSNKAEKGEQVAKMLQIFEKAKHVFVWLGLQSEDSDLAMTCVQRVNDLRSKIPRRPSKPRKLTTEQGSIARHSQVCVSQLSRCLQALEKLFSRPWLGRTWVRQEVFAARSLSVHCGSKSARWDAFVEVGHLLKSWKMETPLEQDSANLAYTLHVEELRKNTMEPRGSRKPFRDFDEVLLGAAQFGVNDVRDTVYAVLGMCGIPTSPRPTTTVVLNDQNIHHDFVQIDYSQDIAKVYRDATLYLLGQASSPQAAAVFNYSIGRQTQIRYEGLPSWARDWQREICIDKETISRIMRSGDGSFFPFGQNAPVRRMYRVLPNDESKLVVRGLVLAYVESVLDQTCVNILDYSHAVKTHRSTLTNMAFAADTDFASENLAPIDKFHSQRRLAKLAFLCPRSLMDTSDIGRDDRFPAASRAFQNDVQDRIVKEAIVPVQTQEGDILVAVESLVLPLLLRGTERQISELSFLEALRSANRTETGHAWETQDFELIGPTLFEWTQSLSRIRLKTAPWSVEFIIK